MGVAIDDVEIMSKNTKDSGDYKSVC